MCVGVACKRVEQQLAHEGGGAEHGEEPLRERGQCDVTSARRGLEHCSAVWGEDKRKHLEYEQ